MNVKTPARIIFILSLLFASTAPGAAPAPGLSLSGKTKLVLDATCTTCLGGTLDLYLRNNGAEAVPLLLHTGDLVNKTSGEPLAANLTQELLNPDLAAKFGAAALDAGATLVLRLAVSGVLDEGEWEAKLYNNDAEVGTFSVVRVHLPFNVNLDLPKADTPEISVQMDKPFFLPLKNDDLHAYPLAVELIVKSYPATFSVTLPPRGTANLKIPAATLGSWFDNPWEGHFRDETVDGRLLMTLARPPCPSGQCPERAAPLASPSKVISFKVHLRYQNPGSQFLAIALLLLAGALCSLFLNSYLPNQLRRIQLKKDLDGLAARVRDLPMKIASRLRVSLGLDEKRCLALLTSQVGFQPGFAAVLTEVKEHMDSLEKRLVLTERLGSLRVRFEAQRSLCLFPTPMDKIAADFEKAADNLRGLEFSDEDLQAAQAIVKSLADHIDDLDELKTFCAHRPDLVSQIEKRALRLMALFKQKPDSPDGLAVSQSLKYPLAGRMVSRLEALERKKETDAAAANPPGDPGAAGAAGTPEHFLQEDLPDVDRVSAKLEILHGCANLDNSTKAFSQHVEHLVDLLESQNSETFDAARQWYQQIKERIFVDDAVEEIVSHAKPGHDEIFRNWGSRPLAAVVGRLFLLVLGVVPFLLFFSGKYTLAAVFFGLLALALALEAQVLGVILGAISSWLDHHWPKRGAAISIADPNRVRIEIETSRVCTYEPIQLRVRFCREDLNVAEAIEDITPIWRFGHDDLTPESGWEVVHYFPRPGSYIIGAEFQRRSGGFLRTTDSKPAAANADDPLKRPSVVPATAGNKPAAGIEGPIVFTKRKVEVISVRSGSRWSLFLEAARLLVALVPALLALYAGAIDKLAKLDLVSALTAVFLLGFSSDQIKNLLTQKSP